MWLDAMECISASTLPPGYSFERTSTAFHEKAAEGSTAVILGLAILPAYLSRDVCLAWISALAAGDPGADIKL